MARSYTAARATEAVRTALGRTDVTVLGDGTIRWPTRATPQLEAAARAIVDAFDVEAGLAALNAQIAVAGIPLTMRIVDGGWVYGWDEIATTQERATAAAAVAGVVLGEAADQQWLDQQDRQADADSLDTSEPTAWAMYVRQEIARKASNSTTPAKIDSDTKAAILAGTIAKKPKK